MLYARPAELDQHGEVRVEPLAHNAAALPEEDALRDLLRDRRRAAEIVAVAIVLDRLVELLEIDAVVLGEALVLGGDDGKRGVPGDGVAGGARFGRARDPAEEASRP